MSVGDFDEFLDTLEEDEARPALNDLPIEALIAELERRIGKKAHTSVRCPNDWKCKKLCLCHRLGPEDMEADLAEHYLLTSLHIRLKGSQ